MSQIKWLPLAMLLAVGAALSQAEIEAEPAERAPLADESLILDVIQAGERYIAVGARGHVLMSDDGHRWQQAESVPVRSTLTRVAFAAGGLWAVGHDTTIIFSADMGQTWSLQSFEPEWERPLLDVHFFDARRGLATGAYGLIMHTDDGGNSWQTLELADAVVSEAIDWGEAAEAAYQLTEAEDEGPGPADVENEFYDASEDFDRGCYEFLECHLNAILAVDDEQLLIAAERGYGFRSGDGGQTWESIRMPYPGSMFGLLASGNDILAFGLRGHVQLTSDFGSSWELLDSGVQASLMGGTVDPDGNLVMVGAGATILSYRPRSGSFRVSQDRLGSDYAAVLFTADGGMILAGEDGLSHD